MATKSSTLVVKVISDASQAQKDLADTAGRIEGFQKKLAAAAVGFFAVDKLMSGVKAVVNAASDLEQAVGGTDAVFKESASAVHKWAADTTDAVRLPQAAYEQLATVIGAQLKNAGTSMGELAPKTQELMTLGADLAATFGTDVASAIEAISAALKGERDPIERYGVSIKQAAVNAKALELAQGDQAKAATQAMQAQATLALIYEQTADAQGAAARESETFQARLDSVKEKLTNLGAAVGGPLLEGFGSLLDRFGELAPSIEPVGVAISSFVSAIAQLPTPVLLAGTAVAGLVLLGPKVVASLAGIGPALTGLLANVKTLWAGLVTLFTTPWGLAIVVAITAIAAAIAVWTSSAQKAAEQAKITAAATNAFYDVLKRGGTGGDLRMTAFNMMFDKFGELGATVTDVSTKIGVSVQDMITGLASNGREGAQVIDAFNTKIAELETHRMSKGAGKGSVSVLTPEAAAEIELLTKARDAYQGMTPAIEAARQRLDEYNAAMGDGVATTEELEAATQDLKAALEDAQKAAKLQFELGEGNQALLRISSAADQAARSAEIFNAKMDESRNRNRDYQGTTLEWADGIRSVGQAFKDTEGNIPIDALMKWDIGALASTESGSRLASSLLDQSSKFGTFVTAAFEAAGGASNMATATEAAGVAADQAFADFVSMATGMGLTSDQAGELANQLGIVDAEHIDDKIFEIIANDQKAAQTTKLWEAVKLDDKTQRYVAELPAAAELAAQMNAIIDGTTPNPVETPAEVTGAAEAGAAASAEAGAAAGANPAEVPVTAPGGAAAGATAGADAAAAAASTTATVPVDAATEAAQGKIDSLGQGVRQVSVLVGAETTIFSQAISALIADTPNRGPARVTVAAQPDQANAAIRAVVGGQYSTIVHLMGDSVPVNNTIRAVIGGQYSLTVQINGDNSGAISAIRSVTTGNYSAIVRISADASGFWSVWNALPTSKTITITTQQQTVNLPPAPAPGLLVSGPAPSLRATEPRATGPTQLQRSGAGGDGNIVINVNGALDPDAVARQIKRLIVDRDRRTGGIVVGTMRARIGSQ